MTTKRRKADKLPLPKTTEEAIDKLGRYAELDASIEAGRAEAEAEIARIRAACDIVTTPLEAELKATFNVLKPWWAVEGDALTDGKRKSLELGGCVIGHRMTPPKVDLGGLSESAAIGALNMAELNSLIRVKTELDKPAMLHWLIHQAATPVARMLRELGFGAKQKEEFFIDRIPPKAPAVEIVAPLAEQVPA